MGGKHSGKRRNYSLRAISPFPTVFLKMFVLQTRKKPGLVWERVNPDNGELKLMTIVQTNFN